MFKINNLLEKYSLEEIVYIITNIYLFIIINICIFKYIGNIGIAIFLGLYSFITFMSLLIFPLYLEEKAFQLKDKIKYYYIVISFILILLNVMLTRNLIKYG